MRMRMGEEKKNFQQIRHYIHFPSQCSRTRNKGLELKIEITFGYLDPNCPQHLVKN